MAKSGKIGFRDSYLQCKDIMGELKRGIYKKIYFLQGDEPFFIDIISDYISKNSVEEEMMSFNMSILYGNSTSVSEVVALARQFPMIGDRSVVIVKEAQSLSDFNLLSHYINEPLSSTILVLCYKNGKIDKRSKLYKSFGKDSVVFESTLPREYEVEGWITDSVRDKGLAIDIKGVQMLVQHLGADLTKIVNELDKLITALPKDTKIITPTDIENYVGISKDYNNFELTRALSEGDVHKAMLIAYHFADSQKQNPYVVTIQMLHTHFYRIFSLALLQWQTKKQGHSMPPDDVIARTLQLPSVFFLKEYYQAIKFYNSSRAFSILNLLREYDLKGKGVGQGSANTGELLRELILKIVNI